MNLGYHLSQRGNRVLLVDMDPQASLTIFMGLSSDELEKTVYEAVIDEEPLWISEGIMGMDLTPANTGLAAGEILLSTADLRELRLKQALDPIEEYYDFILIDCPPSLGLLSYLSLVAATHLLIPIHTHFKAFEGTDKLLATVARVKKKINRQLKIAGFVPTIYAAANSQDVRTLAVIQEQLSTVGKIFPPIPRATAFADASEKRLPLALYSPKHRIVAILDSIAESLESMP